MVLIEQRCLSLLSESLGNTLSWVDFWYVLIPRDLLEEFNMNWKKKVQDSLSHNRDVFESGTSVFGKKGSIGMKELLSYVRILEASG